ncbi:hypothetical protein ACOXXX_01795 [Thalassococcus sp. BH17M4-6]|uniref:annexin n=1 Tax=Thalassococcus sp. BH17M4-6 TaxID=3413148 RepID=UPI003BC036AD
MAPPRDPRRQRTRARLSPDAQVADADMVVAATPEVTAQRTPPVSNRGREALLARLRARAAERSGAQAPANDDVAPAARDGDDPASAQDTADADDVTAADADVDAGQDAVADAPAAAEPKTPDGATNLTPANAATAPGTSSPPATPAADGDAAIAEEVTTPAAEIDAAAAADAPDQKDLDPSDAKAAAPDGDATVTAVQMDAPGDGPAGSLEPDAGDGGDAPEPAPVKPGPALKAWHSRTVGAAKAIPQPAQPKAAAAPGKIKSTGQKLRKGRSGRRAAIQKEAAAAISKPPKKKGEIKPPVTPPPDPVPGAYDLVKATADKKLPDVKLPDLKPSPRGSQPLIPDPNAKKPPPVPAPTDAAGKTAPATSAAPGKPAPGDQKAADAVADAAAKPAPKVPPGTATGPTLKDTPPPPRKKLPPHVNNVMKQVLARLMINPQEQAKPIITNARKEAYPNNVLAFAYKDIGNDKLPALAGDLKEALNLIAADAGIAGEELKAEVEKRKAAATETAKKSADAQGKAQSDEKDALSKESGKELGEVNAAEDAQHARTTATVEAATGEGSPQVIDARRDGQIRKINRMVGDIRFGYDRAKDRRHAALDRARAVQIKAYDKVKDADIKALNAAYKKAKADKTQDSLGTFLEIGKVNQWAEDSKRALNTKITEFKTAATNQTKGFRKDTYEAGRAATEKVRTWASELKGETTSWWDKLWALFSDWSQQAEVEAENWSGVRASEARDATVQNMGVLSQFMQTQGEAVNLETNAAFKTLSAEQQTVIKAYYAAPAGKRDAIGAVAAGLKFRLAAQQKPLMIEKMKKEVMAKPDSEWKQFEQIGAAQTPGFSAASISSKLYDAMFGGVTGWGTDEDKIYNSLTGLTKLQGRAVRANYRIDYGRNLDSDLASELDADNALVRAKAALDGDPVIEAVGALNEAMAGLGTDEDTIMKVLRGKTAEQRARIVEEYRRRYGVDLNAALKSEMSSHDLDRSQALLAGNTAKADAIALDQAMHGGFLGWGTDEKKIEDTYAAIRADAAKKQVPDGKGGMRPLTAQELEEEVRRRNAHVEVAYNDKYGTPGDQKSALRAAYKSELSGPDLDLATALADNDLVAADAARLERERQGFYTDDDVVNNVLETQYTRSLDALKRDPKWRAEREALQKKAAKEHWDPYKIAAAERALDRRMEEAAKAGAQQNMAALENTYDTKYSRWGKGGLKVMIAYNMSGTDKEKAQTLLKQGGHLTRAQRFDYATRGLGTDEDDAKKALAGATAAEIAEIDKQRAKQGLPSVKKTIDSEMSGRDNFDTKMLAKGVPENADQEIAQAREKARYELRNSPVGGLQREVLKKRMARMEKQYKLINDPKADPFERRRALDQFRQRGQGVQAGVDSYRAQVDAMTDAVATGVAIAAAVTVTALTAGAAGLVIAGALGALAAASATMTVKAVMKGEAYGTDEMAIDAVVGIVDAAAAMATAGMGNALLRVATSQAGRFQKLGGSKLATSLARMAASGSRTQRMIAHGVSETVEGAASTLPSALAGNMLNDKNWEKGNPLTNILGSTLVQTGMGGVVSGGLGSLGGIKMPKTDPPTPRTGDILNHRGTPQDRLAAWKEHKAANPHASMSGFLRQYDAQIKDRLAAEARDAGVQRALRTELYAGIPPQQRRAFKDVQIEVMPEKEFRAFTRSDSGNAVTIIDGGKPKIILRDGAPPGVLREEGIHLQQLMDPELGPLVRRLDEAKLQDWDSLPLAEKMELYAIKVELEIDAQIRLIDGLDADIRATRPGPDLDKLTQQKALAETSLNNLRRRADEVSQLGPLERIAMARGLRDPPPYLDQPARLFSKGKKKPPAPKRLEPAPPSSTGTTTPVDLPPVADRSAVVDGIEGTISTRGSSKILADTKSNTVGFEIEVGGAFYRIDQDSKGQLMQIEVDALGVPVPGATRTKLEPNTLVDGDLRIHTRDGAGNIVSTRTEPVVFAVRGKRELEVRREYFMPDARQSDGSIVPPVERAQTMSGTDLRQLGWGASGSAVNRKGAVAELASQTRSQADLKATGNTTQAAIDLHQKGGQGFDGIELHLIDGVPVVRIIEVKNYNDYVDYVEFTAVNRNIKGAGVDNLQKNLDDLDARLKPTPTDLAEARRQTLIVDDPPDPVGYGPGGMWGQDYQDSMDRLGQIYDDLADGTTTAERALADQADLARRQADIADQRVADRLGVTRDQVRQMRQAMANRDIELEIRLTEKAKVGVADTGGNMSTMNRLKLDWDGFRPILEPRTISDADLARATRVFDGTRALGLSERMFSTGRADIPYVDAEGRLLAMHEVTGHVNAQDPADIAKGIIGQMRGFHQISQDLSGFPHMVVDLGQLNGDRAALRRAIEDELDKQKPPITDAERLRLIFWTD